jgi:hypothetical protein
MLRNLKALGLALVAAFALSAVGASAASAQFVSGSHETILTAESTSETQAFVNSEGLAVSCTGVDIANTIVGTSQETVAGQPVYSGCSIVVPGVGSFNAFVTTTGCTYVFTLAPDEVHVECHEGKQIEVKGEFVPPFKSKCLDIGSQTPTEAAVSYTNKGSGSTADVEIVSGVEGVTYTETGICGEGTFNDADYTGSVTVTGESSEKNHVSVAVE